MATGSFCVVAPMYISEIAESSIRGTLGTLFQLTLSIGILLVYIIGAMVTWTTLSVLCLLVPVALFIGMLFLPETPTYLLKKVRRYLNCICVQYNQISEKHARIFIKSENRLNSSDCAPASRKK